MLYESCKHEVEKNKRINARAFFLRFLFPSPFSHHPQHHHQSSVDILLPVCLSISTSSSFSSSPLIYHPLLHQDETWLQFPRRSVWEVHSQWHFRSSAERACPYPLFPFPAGTPNNMFWEDLWVKFGYRLSGCSLRIWRNRVRIRGFIWTWKNGCVMWGYTYISKNCLGRSGSEGATSNHVFGSKPRDY